MAEITLRYGAKLGLDVWVHRQYPAENRTEFQAVLYLAKGSGWPTSTAGASWSVRSPDGTVQRSGSIAGYDLNVNNRIELSRSIISFNHNSDGTFTAREWTGHFSDTGNVIGSGSVRIASVGAPTIARATVATLPGGFTTGSPSTIQLLRASSNFTHDVSWKFGAKSGTITTGAGVSAAHTPLDSIFTELTDAESGLIDIITVTKQGTTVIGTTTAKIPITAGPLVVPNVTAVTWDDQNPIIAANIGGIVQGRSIIKGAVTAEGFAGSTILERRLTVAGAPKPLGEAFAVPNAGTIAAFGEATDSRGRVGKRTSNIVVLPYEPPKLGANGWSVQRANDANVADPSGEYLRVDLHASVASLIVGTQKNQLKVVIVTKASNGPPVTRNTIVHGSLSINQAIQVSDGAVFDELTSYEVTVTVSDNAGSTLTLTDTVSTSEVTMDWNGNKLGLGKMHEQGGLDVAGDIYSDGAKASLVGHTHTGAQVAEATEASRGTAERATQAEVDAGTDATRFVSPKTLRDRNYAPHAMAAGSVAKRDVVTNGASTVTVTLPVGRFDRAPIIAPSVLGSVREATATYDNVTTTSFELTLGSNAPVTRNFGATWTATQMTATSAAG